MPLSGVRASRWGNVPKGKLAPDLHAISCALQGVRGITASARRSKARGVLGTLQTFETGKLVIEIQELCKYYGHSRAIGPLSATIEKGEVVGLLGLNGAGKTTTLRILACDLLPSSGTV